MASPNNAREFASLPDTGRPGMSKAKPEPTEEIDLRELVKACAANPEIVALFNAAHGLNLPCPVEALIDPVLPEELTEDESMQITWFIAWVGHSQWRRTKAALSHIRRLKSIHEDNRRT